MAVPAVLLLVLLAAGIAAVWLPARVRLPGVGALIAATLGAGLWLGALTPVGLLPIALLFAAAWWAAHGPRLRALGWVLFVLTGLVLAFGLAPGFTPLALTEAAALKPDSAPYALRVRLDKPLIAVPLLLWLVPLARTRAAWGQVLRVAAPVGALTLLVVGAAALASGYVHWLPGLPPAGLVLAWATVNLLLVCTVEEGFFRGVVQRGLTVVAPLPLALGAGALAFGLAHAGGGALYVALATLAGAGYGLAFHYAGQRVEAAILAHFGLNIAHLALLTYPYAQAA